MKMDKNQSGGDDQSVLSSLEWSNKETLALTNAIIADGKFLLPAGINKHFNMMAIHKRFYAATKKHVETKVLWKKIYELFDIPSADAILNNPFPDEQTEFTLPEKDFNQLIRDRKNQSSQDTIMDDEDKSEDSGSESPPTLPIAKKEGPVVASYQATPSSRKRKSDSSFSGSSSGGKSFKAKGDGQASNV